MHSWFLNISFPRYSGFWNMQVRYRMAALTRKYLCKQQVEIVWTLHERALTTRYLPFVKQKVFISSPLNNVYYIITFWKCKLCLAESRVSIDHLHNGDRFKYSFMCILISLLGLVSVSVIEYNLCTWMRPRRLIKMHIKEYLNRSPLCKWSITVWKTRKMSKNRVSIISGYTENVFLTVMYCIDMNVCKHVDF